MACFSNKTKHCCAKFIMIVSIFLCAIGLFAGLFGYFGLDIKDSWKLGDTTFPSPVALFGILAIIAGLFSVVTGLFGIAAAKFKKCCFTLPFMIFAIVMCIVMLVVSLLALVGQADPSVVRKEFCDGNSEIDVDGTKYKNLNEFMLKNYGGAVDQFMCTGFCPCD